MSKRKRLDKHHIKPRSRFEPGEDVDRDNTCYWDTQFHRHWHALFNNMTIEEVHALIDTISQPHSVWDGKRLKNLMDKLKEDE